MRRVHQQSVDVTVSYDHAEVARWGAQVTARKAVALYVV